MTINKTEYLNMRIKPATKRALRVIAERENRSMANALEFLVEDYIARNQVELPRANSERIRTHAGRGGEL